MADKNIFLQSMAQSTSDMLHRVIGNTFIIEYGIVKAIPAEGIVTVEMSVTDNAENIVITDCVLANTASSSFSVNIKPQIDDKVMVLFPRKFHTDMFQQSKNEPIISEATKGYNMLSGIALLMNQFQSDVHKNYIEIDNGCIHMKNNNVEVTTDKDNAITVKNGKATINIDKNGNVKVETTGKYTVKNNTTDLASVISALADEIENLAIVCPNGTGTVDPDSVTSIETWKTGTLKALLDS